MTLLHLQQVTVSNDKSRVCCIIASTVTGDLNPAAPAAWGEGTGGPRLRAATGAAATIPGAPDFLAFLRSSTVSVTCQLHVRSTRLFGFPFFPAVVDQRHGASQLLLLGLRVLVEDELLKAPVEQLAEAHEQQRRVVAMRGADVEPVVALRGGDAELVDRYLAVSVTCQLHAELVDRYLVSRLRFRVYGRGIWVQGFRVLGSEV